MRPGGVLGCLGSDPVATEGVGGRAPQSHPGDVRGTLVPSVLLSHPGALLNLN